MNRILVFLMISLIAGSSLFSQVSINTDGDNPDPSAGLEVDFSNKGFLPPRMTFDQRNAIPDPAEGLMVYCTDCNADGTGLISVYQAGSWKNLNMECTVPRQVINRNHDVTVTEITWRWEPVPIATGYKWNNVPDYNTAIDLGPDTAYTETGLSCATYYLRWVWTYNDCGHYYGREIYDTTLSIPFSPAPTEGTHVPSFNEIQWNWNAVPDATGYKWNTSNDLYSATDLGAATTTTETGLQYGTNYTRYVWAYNNCGVSIVTQLSQATRPAQNCPGSITDERDGKIYNTVLIGCRCWMAENLNIGSMIQGGLEQNNHNSIEKYCYENAESNCSVYGGLYQWDNMMQWSTDPLGQGICPSGWHIPTKNEWYYLRDFLGGASIAGGKMKETGLEHWYSPNEGATNESGFTALPGGGWFITNGAAFKYLNYGSLFWASTESSSLTAPVISFDYYSGAWGNSGANNKSYGWSVRCILD